MSRALHVLAGTACVAIIAIAAVWFWQLGAAGSAANTAEAERLKCAGALAAAANAGIEDPAFRPCVMEGLITMGDATQARRAAEQSEP